MNKERYVSYDIAKLLKEKGFDWRVFNFYDEHGIFSEHIGSVYTLYNWNYPTKDEYGSQYCSAPTQQMAIDWLEEWGIIVEIGGYSVDTNGNPHYGWCVLNKKAQYLVLRGQYYEDSRNEAVEAALKYVLENLI